MGKTHKSNYLIWTLLFTGVVGILVSGSSSSTVFGFQIQPLALAGNVELPDILCNTKASVSGIGADGSVVLSEQSTPFDKHPKTTWNLVGGADKLDIESFKVENKMRCDFINGATFVPMTVANSDLTVVIYAKDSVGVEKQVWNKTVKSSSAIPIINNHEEVLSTTSATTVDINKYLEAGDYESTLRFVTYGTVTIFYDGYDYVKYDVAIPDNKIQTFITLDVTKIITGSGEPPKPKDPPKGHLDCVDGTSADISLGEKCPESPIFPTSDITELISCMQSFDIECLSQSKFLPYFIGGFGMIFLLGAITTRKKPMFDQLGNRVN